MTHLSEAILHDTTGIVLTLSDAMVATCLHDYADFFVIDAAARLFSADALQGMIAAAKDKPVFVRVENTSPSTLQYYLNIGADGLILTNIHYAAEAEKAIAACLYPPEGIRPYRPLLMHEDISLQAMNDQITLIVEVAHAQTITQIEEIAEVTGINGLVLSPQRLAVAMEKDLSDVTVQQAMQSVALAARSYDLPFGLEGEAEAEGFNADFRLPYSDAGLLMTGLRRLAPGLTGDSEEDNLHLVASR